MTHLPVSAAVELAAAMAVTGRRQVLGIAGAPGSGKSTLAAAVVDAVGAAAVLVPMDGFHLSQSALERLGRADRKGAPDTFDAAGYVALLSRARVPGSGTVWAPEFDRHLEEAVAGSIAVEPSATLVVTEGNYLLLDDGDWAGVRPLLDACWFLTTDDAAREQQLVDRHVDHGRTPDAASDWVRTVDGPNARLVAATAGRADLVLTR